MPLSRCYRGYSAPGIHSYTVEVFMVVATGKKNDAAVGFVNKICIIDKNGVKHEISSNAITIAIKDAKLFELINGKEITLCGLAAMPQAKEHDYSGLAL